MTSAEKAQLEGGEGQASLEGGGQEDKPEGGEAKSSAEEAAEKAKLEDPPALKPEPASSKKGPKKVLILTEEERLQIEVAKSSMSIEDLLPEHRLKYERVLAEGKRVCSRCRWSYGCLMCHPEKAWDYWVRQTLGYDGSKAKAKKG